MLLVRRDAVPSRAVEKEGRSEFRCYYDSDSDGFHLVITHVPLGHVQNVHRHERMLDIIYVISGRVGAVETGTDEGDERAALGSGDLVVFRPPGYHNLENTSGPAPALLLQRALARLEGSAQRAWQPVYGGP